LKSSLFFWLISGMTNSKSGNHNRFEVLSKPLVPHQQKELNQCHLSTVVAQRSETETDRLFILKQHCQF
jgi:hypothetical protein